MLDYTSAFSSYSVDDAEKARTFYSDVLGLDVTGAISEEGVGMLTVQLDNGGHVMLYQKPNHEPASFTVLNFAVDDIKAAVQGLTDHGVTMLRYDGLYQDELGVSRGLGTGRGPDIAWFNDPAGNILAVLQQTPSQAL